MSTDTTEKGLEDIIVKAMTGVAQAVPMEGVAEAATPYGGTGWILGHAKDYSRDFALDLVQLRAFLEDTQPALAKALDLGNDSPTRLAFLSRLQGEITKHGIIHVLRKGISHQQHSVTLFYATPSEGNDKAQDLHAKNRFSVTRQLQYSKENPNLALDLGLFINGLPIATLELKNNLTKQTVADAVEQYKQDRDPKELMFGFKRCMVHLAVDDQEVRMCTELKGKASWFLPFNKGCNKGAGNPVNPDGIKTDYLWLQTLTPEGLTEILENYAQVVLEENKKTGKKKAKQIFPRYHQLDVVRSVLAHVSQHGTGHRYLIQHSAGSGKSNSIAWLAHQLMALHNAKGPVYESIIVITDRKVLDKQIRDTIKGFAQVDSVVGHATDSSALKGFIADGKKIIISTVQKFPFIVDEISNQHRGHAFAIVIDEAHSSQGGKTAAAMHVALSEAGKEGEEENPEDRINRFMEAKKMLPNASYFAFTATPKPKTLELFGEPFVDGGMTRYRPFHEYSMKQAIEERFILDVLQYYTPVNSFYKLKKVIEDNPLFDEKKAKKKLRHYVEGNSTAIERKTQVMIEHFMDSVVKPKLMGGQARAMVVTGGVKRAIQYFHAFNAYLKEIGCLYRPIVAFSGEHEVVDESSTSTDHTKVEKVTESKLNGFPSSEIEERFQEEPYRWLICADKFQTGYDEPLLQTMYVDKTLEGIKAVQTLSRLNRAHPLKQNVFVLDFLNDVEGIQAAFQDYYQTTVLSQATDPNKLNDLKGGLDDANIYTQKQVQELSDLFLAGAERPKLDPILDKCRENYLAELDEDGQVKFKGDAKAFVRTYDFLCTILPYTQESWERLSIFLNFLIPKLPAPKEEDLAKGILDAINMDSYRAQKQVTQKLILDNKDALIDPSTVTGGGAPPEPELKPLDEILKEWHQQWGNIDWKDKDKVEAILTKELPAMVAQDKAFQNARQNSDEQNARIEHDKALGRAITSLVNSNLEIFKLFSDNDDFKRFVTQTSFRLNYDQWGLPPKGPQPGLGA